MADKSFDYIVIGAGSAGCVVANRLSADPAVKVLLIEAGPADKKPEIHEPRDVLKTWGSEIDWNYVTEPVPALKGRQIPIARGKVLGGCSSIFAMIHIRGNRRDFDHWNYLGNEGWSYHEVLPYFKKSEDFEGGASEYHGAGGPLSIRYNPNPTPVAYAFCDAAVQLGYQGPKWNFNAEQQEDGAGLYQHTITKDNKRASTAVAFLKPILNRPNLSIVTEAQAKRLVIENGRVTGVETMRASGDETFRAEREIIVCAGAFDSPKLLMLSGLGPASHLKEHGIKVQSDLPGVGRNMQDHVLLPVPFKTKKELPPPMFIAEAGLFVRTRPGLTSASPDLQFHFAAGIPGFLPPELGPWFGFVPILAQPQSVGTVTLRSGDWKAAPVLQPNYMSCETDISVLRQGIELSRQLAATKAFAEFNGGEIFPGPGKSEAEIRDFILAQCRTVWHPIGTCKMGRDAMAVVDPQLRVYGVKGLRVADASVMPKITAGNTNAACMMIGEKAADLARSHPA